MKKILVLVFIFINSLFAISTTDYDKKENQLNLVDYGYANPIDGFVGAYVAQPFYSSHYYSKYQHTGSDFMANAETNVYSICDGKVIESADMNYQINKRGRNNYNAYYNSRIIIQCSKPSKFLVIYGHINNASVKVGDTVNKGQDIAEIAPAYNSYNKRYSNNDHLHFGININSRITYTSGWGWGVAPKSARKQDVENKGFRDPFEYLTNNSNNDISFNGSIFDGAGSLVGAYDNIAGGNYDYALMQSHPNNSSTVVFQWLYDIDQCSQIDLFSYPNKLDVTIKTKKWHEHTIKEAFNVTLNKYNKNDLSNGISLKKRNGNDWTTLSVTSKEPLSSSNYIIAHCRDNSEQYKDGNRQNITPTLVNLPNDYYWSGTASLISQIQNRIFEEAGVGIDYAVTYSGHKSFTTFQWYAGDNCRKVKIKGYNESKSNINEVAIKVWDDNEWTTKCTNSLPCIISAPKVPEYYIIKIKSNANDIKSGSLQTECVQ